MALIGHWKLNGDAQDSSGNGNHGTTSSVSYGQGIIDNDTAMESGYITIPNSDSLQVINNYTITFWFKPNSAGERRTIIDKAYGGEFTINHETEGDLRFYHGEAGKNSSPYESLDSEVLSNNVWTHCAIVYIYNEKRSIWYLNGRFSSTRVGSYDPSPSTNPVKIGIGYTDHPVDGSIDDVRIYNHALSERDIGWLSQPKELSIRQEDEINKAMILWYPMDEQPQPTENLLNNPLDSTTWRHLNNPDYGFVSEEHNVPLLGTTGYRRTCYGTDYRANRLDVYWDTPTDMSKYYTSSIYVRCLQPNDNTNIRLNYQGLDSNGSRVDITQSTNITDTNWHRAELVASPSNNNFSSLVSFMKFYLSGDSENRTWEVVMPQTEQNSVVTPFVNGSRSGVVEDYSGNNNYSNLQSSTMPTWKNNSILGTGAYEFSSYPQHIMSSTKTSQFVQFTYSCWVYRTVQQESMLILGSRYGNNTYISMSINKNNKLCLHKYRFNNNDDIDVASSSKSLDLNTWYHLVVTYDNGDTKSYVDGILEGSEYHLNTSDDAINFQINYDSNVSDTYRYFHGMIDDVRVYNTALTEQQVFQLYDQKTRASIDKNGNFWAREFLNQNSSKPLSIGKLQNIKSGNEGSERVSIRSDGVYANRIIRY